MSKQIVTYNNKKSLVLADTEIKRYLKSISNTQMLSAEEEYNLAIDLYKNKNKLAAEKLLISHLPLVVKIAYSYKNYGLPVADLISEGNIGLMRAITKFDPTKGFRLSTYAMWWIRAYMSSFVLDSWSLVKSGTLLGRKKLFFSLNKIKQSLGITNNNLTEENINSIAQISKTSKQDVIDINNMVVSKDISLNAKLGFSDDSDNTLEDVLQDSSHNPEEELQEKQQQNYIMVMIKEVLSALSDKEKFILINRYTVEKPLSLEAIGKELGISRERVRQIEQKALIKARSHLQSKNLLLI
jgi:RNA polymerase sigma-32 factor